MSKAYMRILIYGILYKHAGQVQLNGPFESDWVGSNNRKSTATSFNASQWESHPHPHAQPTAHLKSFKGASTDFQLRRSCLPRYTKMEKPTSKSRHERKPATNPHGLMIHVSGLVDALTQCPSSRLSLLAKFLKVLHSLSLTLAIGPFQETKEYAPFLRSVAA